MVFSFLDQANLYNSAFSAKDLAPGRTDVMKNASARLVFINPAVNTGNHYNITTGEYTCPYNGLYFFSFMVQGYTNHNLGEFGPVASLVYHGENVARVRLKNSNSEKIESVLSGSAVVNCKAQNKVWVQTYKNITLRSWSDYPGNVFSGFLIAPESYN